MQTGNPDQQVTFAGDVPYDQVFPLLEKHDILLLASNNEGLPLSLLEAMGQGVVPVISDLESGVRDVVDSSNGIRVPIDEIDGYARAIVWLHEHRDTLSEMRQAAWVRVSKEYSVPAMTQRWLEFFESHQRGAVKWPHKLSIHAPKDIENRILFHPALRPLRRIQKKWLAGIRCADFLSLSRTEK